MSKVLVTGSSGFIGSSICRYFAEQGNDVLGLDLAIPLMGASWQQRQCDLATADLVEILKESRPDIFIHCAGNANVGLSVQDPLMDLNGSVVLLTKIFHAFDLAAMRPKVLFLSSAAVYGNPEHLPIREDVQRRPVSPYGLHKAACEDLCEFANRVHGLDCRVMRIFSAYGAGLRKQILWDLCSKIDNPGKITLFGTGAETRDFIHVSDVVNAAHLILEKGESGVYNVANGVEVRIDAVVKILLRNAGESEERLSFTGEIKPGDPLNWQADTNRLKALGYVPKVSLEDGIAGYHRWRRELG